MNITVDAFLEAKGATSPLDIIETLREFQQVIEVINYRFMPSLRQAGIHYLVDLDNSVIIGTFVKPIEVEQKTKVVVGFGDGTKEIIHLPSRDLLQQNTFSEPKPEAQPEKRPADVPESLPALSPEPEPESQTSDPEPESQTEETNFKDLQKASDEDDKNLLESGMTLFASHVNPDHTIFQVRHLITHRTANALIEGFKTGATTQLKQIAKMHPSNLLELHAFGQGCLNSLASLFETAGITFAKESLNYKEVKEILTFDGRNQ